MVKARRWSRGAAVSFVIVTSACWVEDRGFAADIATHIELLKLRDLLECHRRATRGYPTALADLTSPASSGTCLAPADVENTIRYSQDPGLGRDWHGHAWVYVAAAPDAQGLYQRYELTATDVRGQSRYRSFWLDSTGVLRSATGRQARAGDRPEERQDASSPDRLRR